MLATGSQTRRKMFSTSWAKWLGLSRSRMSMRDWSRLKSPKNWVWVISFMGDLLLPEYQS